MSRARFAVFTVVVLALVGLAAAWGGRVEPDAAVIARSPVPAVRTGGDLGSTWYCAAGAAAVPTSHVLLLSNPTARPTTARLTGYSDKGPTPVKDVEVPANGPLIVDVATTLGADAVSVLVESPEPRLAVDHQLAGDGVGDRASCRVASSGNWYFPALTTTRDAGARLTLFNPFPGDAGIDVAIGFDTGTRVPSALAGIVVPAGTTKQIDLGSAGIAERRDQFTAEVRTRSGRVVAEVSQTYDGSAGPKGLRLSTGVPASSRHWAFAGGFTGTGVAERLVVQNPSDERAHLLVQVTPYGGAAQAPEPIEVDVEPRRYVVVDLSAESRIPGIGYHSIEVEANQPVVVARTTAITSTSDAAPQEGVVARPALSSGVAISTGTPVAARTWLVPSIDAGRDPAPVVLIHNPGTSIAVVTLSMLSGGQVADVAGATKAEVAPGDSIAVPLPAEGSSAEVTIRVVAQEPVVVERITTFVAEPDLGFDLAVPMYGSRSPLVSIGD